MKDTMRVERVNVQRLTAIGILGAIAAILMFFRFPLPFAPGFMDVDIAEAPALIASFAIGPVAGFVVVCIKLLLKLLTQSSSTVFVGELSNLIVSSAFVVTAGLIYHRKKTLKGAILAIGVGIMAMAILASLSNYFVIFPMYGKAMGIDLNGFAEMVQETNPLVKDFKTLIAFSVFPFNLVKGLATGIVTFLLYKRIGNLIKM